MKPEKQHFTNDSAEICDRDIQKSINGFKTAAFNAKYTKWETGGGG